MPSPGWTRAIIFAAAALWTVIALASGEHLADRVVSLPLYPELTEAEVEHVVGVLGATRAILADG